METFALLTAALAATVAFLIGVRRIIGEFAAAARRQYKIDKILHRELTDNGNGSLKSQVGRVGERQAKQEVKIDHVQDTLDGHTADLDLHSSNPRAHDE